MEESRGMGKTWRLLRTKMNQVFITVSGFASFFLSFQTDQLRRGDECDMLRPWRPDPSLVGGFSKLISLRPLFQVRRSFR